MSVPEISPGCAANCFPAMSDIMENIPWKECTMGLNIRGKMLKITWKMSKDARMFESVSMG